MLTSKASVADDVKAMPGGGVMEPKFHVKGGMPLSSVHSSSQYTP